MTVNAAGFDFSKFVPGFDFLRQMTQPRALSPSAAQWVAPTVDPEEVDRRIQELRTVQFWLEQNTTALKATIQALEVQKMTLSTLQDMNVSMNDMAQVFQQAAADTVSSVTQAVKSVAPESSAAQESAAEAPVSPFAAFWQPFAASPEAGSASQPDKPAAPVAPPAAEAPASAQPDAPAGQEIPFNEAWAQAGQWWGSMMNTFQNIAQQAQADVLKHQADFVQAQEEAAARLQAENEARAAREAAEAKKAESAKTGEAVTRTAAARKPAAARSTAAKPAASGTTAKPAAKPAVSRSKTAAAKPVASKPAAGKTTAGSSRTRKPGAA